MSVSPISVIKKSPYEFKYLAYLRVEVQDLVMYYHMYERKNSSVYFKKPHIRQLDEETNLQPIIRVFKKQGYDHLEEEINDAINKKIRSLAETFESNFTILYVNENDEIITQENYHHHA